MARPAPPPARRQLVDRLLWHIVVATVILTPLVVSVTGLERFRLPKELIVRAAALLLLTTAGVGFLYARWRVNLRWRDPVVLLTTAVVLWVVVSATTSTNYALSSLAVLRTFAFAAFFLVAYMLASAKSLGAAIWPLLVPAGVNAVIGNLQELSIWNPFRFESNLLRHAQSVALLGNVNDVGAYLLVPTLVSIAVVLVDPRSRSVMVPIALLLISALLLNQTLTAFAAFSAGAMAIAFMALSVRLRIVAAAGVLVAIAAAVFLFTPFRERAVAIRRAYQEQRYDAIVSGRLPAFAAAWAMAAEYPMTGVGPGCYGFHYYLFRLRMEQRHPFLLKAMTRMQNWGEAHNDHLEVAAETGVPGYVLLLASIGYLGSRSFSSKRDDRPRDARLSFVRVIALPLAVSELVLMLALFPLQLAAALISLLYVAALCAGWTHPPN